MCLWEGRSKVGFRWGNRWQGMAEFRRWVKEMVALVGGLRDLSEGRDK